MNYKLLKCTDISYLTKFFLLFLGLYYFNVFFLGITDPKNYYSYFLDHYLNYIDWIKISILHTANSITHLFGLNSYVEAPKTIKTTGASVLLEFPCLGVGILSFWIAFVVANRGTWKKKLYWCVEGLVFIWFINCWRIALLLVALEKRWPDNSYMDHHDLFNVLTYAIILTLIYFHSKEKSFTEIVR